MDPEHFSLTVLGCDGSFPGAGGACSGYLVRGAGTAIWVDAGTGTMSNIQRHLDLAAIDGIVLTHSHPDHWTDIEGLAVAFRWTFGCDGPPVYAPAGIRESTRVSHSIDSLPWTVIDEGSELKIGSIGLSFFRTDHPVTTLAVRLEFGGRVVGYSADTGPGWELSQLGFDMDLALCEATFLTDKEGTVQHMSARQAGASAARARAKRLVITHVTPGIDKEAARAEASRAFGGPVEVAVIDARYEI